MNPKYKLPFKSRDDAIKRLLRYHVFYDLDASPEEWNKTEQDYENKADDSLDKYQGLMNRYHFLLTQDSQRLVSSSEEVMLARLWDSEERLILKTEKEEVDAGRHIQVPLLDPEKRSQYSEYMSTIQQNQTVLEDDTRKRKRSGEEDPGKPEKVAKTEFFPSTSVLVKNDDSDEEFTLKDVDTERAVGSILDAPTSNDEDDENDEEDEDDEEDDDDDQGVDDVLKQMTGGNEDEVVAAAFGGNDSVQNAINSILDTLPSDRIETPDINNITGLFDSIEDDTASERDPMTEAAVNSIPQF